MNINKFKSVTVRVFKFVLIIICFFIISYNIENNIKIFDFSNKSFKIFILILSLLIVITLLYSILHFITLKKITNFRATYNEWLYIFLNSQFLNSIPFLGIFYRAKALNNYKVTYLNFVVYLFTIKFFFFILASIFFFLEIYYFKINLLNYLITFIVIVFLSLLLIHKYYKKFFHQKRNVIFKCINFFFVNFFNFQYLAYFFIIFIFIHILEISVFFLIVNFNNLELNSITTFFLYITNILIDYFPITPQNLGITEIGMAFVSKDFGFNFADGIILKINFRIFTLIASLISLICFYFYYKLNKYK